MNNKSYNYVCKDTQTKPANGSFLGGKWEGYTNKSSSLKLFIDFFDLELCISFL